jgi:hypothetical protein
MSSLLRSIGEIWRVTPDLYNLIPFDRVFTGRIPQTELYRFPYVSILVTQGTSKGRSTKTRHSIGPVSFHIWVDDANLETAETVAEAIADAYADRCWLLGSSARVLDVIDSGEAMAHQTDMPNVKAWEVIKLFLVLIERDRADHDDDDCCTGEWIGSTSAGSQGSSS